MTTPSQSDGTFQFDNVSVGRHRLWAETDQLTTLPEKLRGVVLHVQAEPPSDPSDIELKLHPGCGYDVTVHDLKTKQPIPGARISFGWTDIVREYITDDDGLAKPRNLAMSDWYFIVRADDYATKFLKTSRQELGTVLPLRFDLEPGGELTGVLRDGDEQPVADAKVSISSSSAAMEPSYGSTVTNAAGEFELDNLPLGKTFRLSASKDGYIRGSHECAVTSAEGSTPADFVMLKRRYGGDVRVTVLDENDEPFPAAKLTNRGNSSADVRSGETDEEGVCLLQDLYTGFAGCQVTVKADGYIAVQTKVDPGTIESPSQITVNLQPGKTLRGQVILPNGDPASNLNVYYDGGETAFNGLGGRVQTDADGKYEIRGLASQTTLTFSSSKKFAPVRNLLVQVTDEEFEFQLQTAGVLIARAVEEGTNAPIASFNVKLGFCEDRRAGDPRPGGIPASLMRQGENIQGTQKEFRLDGQTPGTPYKLIVSADGYETKIVKRVEIRSPDLAEVLEVPLKRMRPENFHTVAGQLLDADGNPIAGASVRLLVGSAIPQPMKNGRMQGWRYYHWGLLRRDDIENRDQCLQLLKTASDANGRFEFTGVRKETPWLELFYFGPDLMPQRYSNMRTFSDFELTDLVVQAEAPASLTVDLDLEEWPEADSVSLRATDYTNGPNAVDLAFDSETQKLAQGTPVVFRNLPSGSYSVQLQASPVPIGNGGARIRALHQQTITIEPGRAHDLNLNQ
ncbi:MSCRAMM family protein [Rhodopirellula sp. P2]|uniref:MSCRAMM family protein n=1 Tax=Rhodopirellula sp. P2 TaxID=2127060 RepID=UPI002368B586|nr:carboxypeptidase-like regulatory domain-containing protein [Rhodopirellula sp. P2]WDQ18712.1 carboxypeptidase-like regulatory domain-containing protein [Rhodopirellula sp. P2]